MFVFIFDLVMGISFVIKNTSGDKRRNQYTAQQTQSSTATWETGAAQITHRWRGDVFSQLGGGLVVQVVA